MGIRGKLLLLAAGIAVPLVIAGALDLRNMWQLSRSQLDDSLKRQVDLASVALERWLDNQKKALDAIAVLAGEKDTRTPTIRENLQSVLRTRPFWLDLRITNAAGTTLLSQPNRKDIVPNALTEHVVSQIRQPNSWAVITDRTVDEARPIVIIAVPIQKGGAVIARIDGAAINQLFDNIELSQHVIISVIDSDGHVLYRRRGSEAHSEADITWSPVASLFTADRTSIIERTSPIDGLKRVYGVARVRETRLVVMIGIPSSTLYEPARQRLIRYAIVGLMALLVAVGAALVIERSIVLPIRRLRATSQLLGGGDLTARAPRLGGGEIGDLGVAFNTMATQIAEREERLKELDRLKSDFVSSVSHELKTPLTTIKLLAHLLQRGDVSEDEKLDYAKTIAVECDRQIDFVGNLLDISRIESGAYKLRQRRVDVRKLIVSCVDIERYRAESLGLTLSTDLPPELPAIRGDFDGLRRVIRSLIDNAIKYTPAGGRITVAAETIDNNVTIAVSDSGKGIAETDLPNIFNKFYRAAEEEHAGAEASSNGTAGPGVGLGLYLAQHIVGQMNGNLSVESKQGVGTTFRVTLPVWAGHVSADKDEESADVKALVGN